MMTHAAMAKQIKSVYYLMDLKKVGVRVPHTVRDNYYIRKALEARRRTSASAGAR
jgi:hypothetical protein